MAGLFAVLLGGNRRDGTLIGHGGAAGSIAVFMLPEKGKGGAHWLDRLAPKRRVGLKQRLIGDVAEKFLQGVFGFSICNI